MAFDIPDGPQPYMMAEVVGTTPEALEPAREWAIVGYGTKDVAAGEWEIIHQWIVSGSRMGILRSISLACTDYANALWTVYMTTENPFVDKKLPGPTKFPFPDFRMGELFLISAKLENEGADVITGYVYIEGKEVG